MLGTYRVIYSSFESYHHSTTSTGFKLPVLDLLQFGLVHIEQITDDMLRSVALPSGPEIFFLRSGTVIQAGMLLKKQ